MIAVYEVLWNWGWMWRCFSFTSKLMCSERQLAFHCRSSFSLKKKLKVKWEPKWVTDVKDCRLPVMAMRQQSDDLGSAWIYWKLFCLKKDRKEKRWFSERVNPSFLSLPVQPPFSAPVALAVLICVLWIHSKSGSSWFSIFCESPLSPMAAGSPAWCSFKNTLFCQQKKNQNRVNDKDVLATTFSVQCLLLQPPSLPSTPQSVGQTRAAPVIPPSPPLKAQQTKIFRWKSTV